MAQQKRIVSSELIIGYENYLLEKERSAATVQKYVHGLRQLQNFMKGESLTKEKMIEWKKQLLKDYATATVNSMLASVNGFFRFAEWKNLAVNPVRIQKSLFLDERKELTKEEYKRLVNAAEARANERLSLVIQTICATGIRVSELKFITVKAVLSGRAEIDNKGKRRMIFLPGKLCAMLKKYLREQGKTAGAVFTTRSGKPLDRSNIWRDMKALCEAAGVEEGKVFPHNLRHLFARTYYMLEKDLSRLADILGHSNISTTRIYTAESGAVHARQMERTLVFGIVIYNRRKILL